MAQPNPYSRYSSSQKVRALLKGIQGHQRWNEALAKASDREAMLDLLQQASDKIGLGLSRRELAETPPLRDWLWFKKNSPLFTIGSQDFGPY